MDYERMALQLGVRLAELNMRRVELQTQLKDVDREAQSIHRTLRHLGPLAGETEDTDSVAGLGVTAAIRKIFRLGTEPLTPEDVKEQMEKRGFSFSGYKMPMASVYTILHRLVDSGEIELRVTEDLERVYVSIKNNKPRR